MKKRNPFTVRTFASLLLPVMFACGGDPAASEPGEPEDLGSPLATSRLTVCRVQEHELPDGTDVSEERYDFEMLTTELQGNLALRQETGLEAVRSCDDARAVMGSRAFFDEARVHEPLEAPAEPFPFEPVDPSSFTQIWKGEPSNDQRVLHIRIPRVLGQSNPARCSAIAISPNHLLTAQHCIPGNATEYWRTEVYRGEPSGPDKGKPVYLGTFRIRIYEHPGYSGTGDTADDVALISLERKCMNGDEIRGERLCSGSPFTAPSTMRVWLGNIGVGTSMQIKGWGSRSRYSQTDPRLHFGEGGAHISIDWRGPSHFLTDGEQHAVVCKGDSGGPAIMYQSNHDYAAGVFSNAYFYQDQVCTRTEGANQIQRWHRINATFPGWVEPRLADNPFFTCPSSGSTCCMRFTSPDYTNFSVRTYARCW